MTVFTHWDNGGFSLLVPFFFCILTYLTNKHEVSALNNKMTQQTSTVQSDINQDSTTVEHLRFALHNGHMNP